MLVVDWVFGQAYSGRMLAILLDYGPAGLEKDAAFSFKGDIGRYIIYDHTSDKHKANNNQSHSPNTSASVT